MDPVIFTAGQTVTAGQLNTLGLEPDTYTPALTSTGTSPTMGSGAVNAGLYAQLNHLCAAWFEIAFGSSMNAGTGDYQVSLPVNVDPGALDYLTVGHGVIYDDGSDRPITVSFVVLPGAPSLARIAYTGSASDWTTGSGPITWAQDDRIVGTLLYPADW